MTICVTVIWVLRSSVRFDATHQIGELKKPSQFFISTEVLQLQGLPLQLKQTVLVTVSPTDGCAPLSQPGAWVLQ